MTSSSKSSSVSSSSLSSMTIRRNKNEDQLLRKRIEEDAEKLSTIYSLYSKKSRSIAYLIGKNDAEEAKRILNQQHKISSATNIVSVNQSDITVTETKEAKIPIKQPQLVHDKEKKKDDDDYNVMKDDDD